MDTVIVSTEIKTIPQNQKRDNQSPDDSQFRIQTSRIEALIERVTSYIAEASFLTGTHSSSEALIARVTSYIAEGSFLAAPIQAESGPKTSALPKAISGSSHSASGTHPSSRISKATTTIRSSVSAPRSCPSSSKPGLSPAKETRSSTAKSSPAATNIPSHNVPFTTGTYSSHSTSITHPSSRVQPKECSTTKGHSPGSSTKSISKATTTIRSSVSTPGSSPSSSKPGLSSAKEAQSSTEKWPPAARNKPRHNVPFTTSTYSSQRNSRSSSVAGTAKKTSQHIHPSRTTSIVKSQKPSRGARSSSIPSKKKKT